MENNKDFCITDVFIEKPEKTMDFFIESVYYFPKE